jgi:hypothetical protein
MTNIHIDLRRIIVEDWLAMPGQDKFKQRAVDILDKWEQLLLNNLDDCCWVRIASGSPLLRVRDHLSLVYVPKDKRDGECYFLAFEWSHISCIISNSVENGFRPRRPEYCIWFETWTSFRRDIVAPSWIHWGEDWPWLIMVNKGSCIATDDKLLTRSYPTFLSHIFPCFGYYF